MEKKLDRNYTRMLRAILYKSWSQHSTKQQLYGHRPPITKTIKIRRTRHAGHFWRSCDDLISDILLWNPSHSRAKAGWPAWTYMQQLCVDTGWSPEDQPEAMNDRKGWRERVRDIRADGTTRWRWIVVLIYKTSLTTNILTKTPTSIMTLPKNEYRIETIKKSNTYKKNSSEDDRSIWSK